MTVALITDFLSLCSAVALWATRTGDLDFEAAVPTMIQMADVRLNNDVRAPEMEALATLTADATGSTPLPLDFLGARSVLSTSLGAEALAYVTPDYYAAYYPRSGIPVGYTVIGDQLRTFPAASGDITLLYYQRIPALDATTLTQNWLIARYPNLYLYAALLEAAPFMEEDARAKTWQAFYEAGLAAANKANTVAGYPGGVMRVSQDTP